MSTLSTLLLDGALDLAERGWPVFPLRPGTKRPALHGKERCPRTGSCADGHQGWEQRATTDVDRIRAAWGSGPFNIGLACGPAGLVVIDLDTGKLEDGVPEECVAAGITHGAQTLDALAERAGSPVPATFTVDTPSGGRHMYFQAPAGVALRNTAGELGNGLGLLVDTRAHGGYVVAPGSITRAGTYLDVDDRDPAPLPGWLLQRLRPAPPPPAPSGSIRTASGRISRYLQAAITAETERVHNAPAGQRNACLYVASVALGQLVEGGSLAEHDARAALLSAAGRHLALGAYSPTQAEKTITSGLTAGARRPRTITDPIGDAA